MLQKAFSKMLRCEKIKQDREKGMEKILKKAGAILATFLGICIAATTFMNYLTIDVSGGSSTMETILSWVGIDRNISLTGQDLFYWGLHMNETMQDINQDVGAGLHKLAFLFIIPFVLLLAAVIFSWIGKIWSWAVSAVASLGGSIFLLLHPLWITPHNVAAAVDRYMETGTTGKIVEGIKGIGKFIEEYTGTDLGMDTGIDVEAVMKEWLMSSLDTGFWVCFGLFIAVFVVAVVSLILCITGGKKAASVPGTGVDAPQTVRHIKGKKAASVPGTGTEDTENKDQQAFFIKPSLCCKFGDLMNMEIDLSSGEDILIGSDTRRCSVIVKDPNSEPVWCMLHYDSGDNMYRIVDVSRQNVYVSAGESSWRPLEKGKMTEIPRASELHLGNTGRIIALS